MISFSRTEPTIKNNLEDTHVKFSSLILFYSHALSQSRPPREENNKEWNYCAERQKKKVGVKPEKSVWSGCLVSANNNKHASFCLKPYFTNWVLSHYNCLFLISPLFFLLFSLRSESGWRMERKMSRRGGINSVPTTLFFSELMVFFRTGFAVAAACEVFCIVE